MRGADRAGPSTIVELVDKLLDQHIYSEIADILNPQRLQPGGAARPGRSSARLTALRVAYLVHEYAFRPRYDRLRDRGMLALKTGRDQNHQIQSKEV